LLHPRPTARSLAAAAALAILAAAPALGAQQAQGTVRDSVSGMPVPGAVVSALDSTGAIAERVVSGGDGRFRITLPVGSATLRVIRIGFRPRDLRLPDVAAARDHPIDIRLSSLPALLSRVHVSDQAICPGADDRSGALALWEQARAGLLAAVVLRQTKPGQMDVLDYVTDEDPGSRLVLRQSIGRVNGSTGRPFVAVNEARGFAEHGYMTRDSSGLTFNAPDADVLLDQEFARTHCFRAVRDDAAHPAQVGLAFEPAPGGRPDGFVDVRGTLWLDSDHPALRTLDFAYTGLDRAYVDAGTGGALGFRNMPNGMVYIDRWNMLLPAMQATGGPSGRVPVGSIGRGALPLPDERREIRVVQLRDVGGVVLSARWPDGSYAETLVGTVTGEVRDRDGLPIAGALVRLDGTDTEAPTDSAGRYVLAPVLPGRYGLDAVDSLYAPFIDAHSASRTIDVGRDTLAAPPIVLSSRMDALGRLCGRDAAPSAATVMVLGRVTGASGPLGGDVMVRARFAATGVRDASDSRHDSTFARPSDEGRFIVCSVPRGTPLRLELVRGDTVLADTSFTAHAWPAQRLEWRVRH
jgi:hypothetical protein